MALAHRSLKLRMQFKKIFSILNSKVNVWLSLSEKLQKLHKFKVLIFEIDQHFALVRAMKAAGFSINNGFPKNTPYRYLRTNYLRGIFQIPERLRIAIYHYKAVGESFRSEFLSVSVQRGHVLWHQNTDNLDLKIVLRFPYYYNYDGDMSLSFDVNGKNVCIITFSIAPGSTVALPNPRILLISSIQGIVGRLDRIRLATEACHNVSPAHMLLLAAETVGSTVNATGIVGIGKNLQTNETAGHTDRYLFDYDEFWMSFIGTEEPRNFYDMPLPLTHKPIESISAKHRSRARKRRELRNLMRDEIQSQAKDNLISHCIKLHSKNLA